jgi:hypothetical protein
MWELAIGKRQLQFLLSMYFLLVVVAAEAVG